MANTKVTYQDLLKATNQRKNAASKSINPGTANMGTTRNKVNTNPFMAAGLSKAIPQVATSAGLGVSNVSNNKTPVAPNLGIAKLPTPTINNMTPELIGRGLQPDPIQVSTPQPNPQQQLNNIRQQAISLEEMINSMAQREQVNQAPTDRQIVSQPTNNANQAEPVTADPALNKLETDIQKLLKLSPEELSTQEDLDKLVESAKKGFLNTRGQAIPMEFITGQLKSIEDRANTLAEPLEAKLSRVQAQRLASLDASKFALERADKKAEILNKDKGEGFTLSAGESRFDEQGNLVASLPKGGNLGTNNATQVQSYKELINQGRAKLSDVPDELLGEVVQSLSQDEGQTPQSQQATKQADVALRSIDQVLNNPALNSSAVNRVLQSKIPGTADYNLDRTLDTLRALIGFDQLQKMREASPTGGALGSITERELSRLEAVSGSLDIGQSSDVLRDNLEQIRESFANLQLINSPDGTPFNIDGVDYIKQGDELVPAEDFNQVGGDTNQASNIPQRNNNPGNLKKGGLADKLATGVDEQGHLVFPDSQTGFLALAQDLQAKLSGNSRFVKANPTLAELGKVYAEDPNWAKSVAKILGVNTTTKTNQVDFNSLVQAIARQEGFYA